MLIKKSTSVEDVERYYSDATTTSDKIEIVNGYKSLRIGLIPRLAQFFITLAKRTQIPFQFSWVKLNDTVSQKSIVNDPICVSAILMSDEVFGDKGLPLKKLLNEQLVNRFTQPIFKNGRQVQMMAVDHSIKRFANPECFYLSTEMGFINRDATYYYELLTSYFKEVNRTADFKVTDFDGLSELLAELIDNTDQHGKYDFNQGIFDKSVRSVVLTSHMLRKGDDISKSCGVNNPIADYINSVKSVDSTLHLLEISIFDSGPGIYKSFNKDTNNVSINDEASVLFKSFLNGVTSKVNGFGVGRGLNKARLILNKRSGFIAIRSGRLSVYRDYKATPLTDLKNLDSLDIKFFDENTRQGSEYSEMSYVEGVSYTILVPLR
ncbi:hypothetical protein Q4575_10635 [Psychrosphaera sp. 1_MG-2023]|uniref:hypothetical protein n=1 Tax=Psychrosphaera sp. 1_MG-2023 TaxID=3062643 RepID=UPI0026E1F8E3|nr:hypothetical protein [Psychrosphaera sp. 1_MG-2023]MDO6719861.1 hypothetical protein [Psychrosphaera sp. 1_MG-2023]